MVLGVVGVLGMVTVTVSILRFLDWLRVYGEDLPPGRPSVMLDCVEVSFSLAAPFALFVAALEPHTLALLTFSCIAPLLPTEWWAGHMRQARARLGLSRRA